MDLIFPAEFDTLHPVPSRDGEDHVNVYSRGKTELGRLLTNFAFTPFKHPKYGHFASMEAYWYWIKTGMKHDRLRRLYGASAKTVGQQLPRVECENFKELILEGIALKLDQTPDIVNLMKTMSPLPLSHYYVYGTNPPRAVIKPEHNWQLEIMEARWRLEYKKHAPAGADVSPL